MIDVGRRCGRPIAGVKVQPRDAELGHLPKRHLRLGWPGQSESYGRWSPRYVEGGPFLGYVSSAFAIGQCSRCGTDTKEVSWTRPNIAAAAAE